ncbi:MAG: hypothetical protein IEMM0002_1370 [bacterium]|nr:MAG: hypothetical protein IEMM0002_1370 [bacterium]
MKSSSAPTSFKDQRPAAFIPFTILCVIVAATYVVTKIDMVNRPALKPISAKKEAQPSPMLGVRAPDFKLKKLGGKVVTLADYKGKILFINIWATWCIPCVEEMPSMERLYGSLKDKDFEMLAISVDKGGEQVVKDFVEKYELTFPVLLDPYSKVAESYKTTGVPETFIINKEGIVIHHQIGPLQWDRPDVARTIQMLVNRS